MCQLRDERARVCGAWSLCASHIMLRKPSTINSFFAVFIIIRGLIVRTMAFLCFSFTLGGKQRRRPRLLSRVRNRGGH